MYIRFSDLEIQHDFEVSVFKDTLRSYVILYSVCIVLSLFFGFSLQYTHQVLSNTFVFYIAIMMGLIEYRRGQLYGPQFNQFLILEYIAHESDKQKDSGNYQLDPAVILGWMQLKKKDLDAIKNQLRIATAVVLFAVWFVVSAVPGLIWQVFE